MDIQKLKYRLQAGHEPASINEVPKPAAAPVQMPTGVGGGSKAAELRARFARREAPQEPAWKAEPAAVTKEAPAAAGAAVADAEPQRPKFEVGHALQRHQLPAPAGTPAASDGWGLAADPIDGGSTRLIGSRLKFRKGEYVVGRDEGTLPMGTQLVAHDFAEAWCKFKDLELVEVIQRVPGQPFPRRTDLGDQNKTDWPIGMNGQPKDPWGLTRYLYLADPRNGGEFTFLTSSFGGQKALSQLGRRVEVMRQSTPGALPLVKLEARGWNSRKYGRVDQPHFEVVKWLDQDGAELPAQSLQAGLDDEVRY